jgi:hypothetical protein
MELARQLSCAVMELRRAARAEMLGELPNISTGLSMTKRLLLYFASPLIAACLFLPESAVDSEPTIVSLQPVRALTSDERYSDEEPAVSPDGQRVVFTRIDAERKQPRVMVARRQVACV